MRAICVVLLAILAGAFSVVVEFQSCSEKQTLHCAVSELRVEPCPEAAEKKPCVIKRGRKAAIEFDFIAAANVDTLTAGAYWATIEDLPLIGMDSEACKYTTCPTTGVNQTYSYQLPIGKKFPVRSYNVKWRLWKDEVTSCCLIFKIKLEK